MKNSNITDVFNITKDLNVLYVEDDIALNDSITEILEDLFSSVTSKFNGVEALEAYKKYHEKHNKYFDLIISDIKMPQMDGVTLTKEIYKLNNSQSVIIVSAHNETQFLIDLINIGVERFLQKPFTQMQLVDSLYSIFNKKTKYSSIIKLDSTLLWDTNEESLSLEGKEVSLTKKERALLKLFIKNGTKITTTDEMFHYLWDEDISNASIDSLKMHISRLRKKLNGLEIETLYNIGYRLNF